MAITREKESKIPINVFILYLLFVFIENAIFLSCEF
jgi:hypothetical protein